MKGDIILKKTDKIPVKCVFEGEESLQEILLHSFKLFIKNKVQNSNITEKSDEGSGYNN